MSNPSDSDWVRMSKMIQDFSNKPECQPFREPVPWKELGLMDYPAIIKTPMDLGTILKKIQKGKYLTLYQCGEDVRLVWSNCMLYNADGSDFYKLADALKKQFETRYNRLLQDIGAAAAAQAKAAGVDPAAGGGEGGAQAAAAPGGGSKVSLQEKRNMAKQLYQISKEDLGKFLIEVENKCPLAIKRNATEDELELNIDAITSAAMPALMEFLKTLAKSSTKKKPPAGGGSKPKKPKPAAAAEKAAV